MCEPMVKTASIGSLLADAQRQNASDLHLTSGAPPVYRIFGKLCFGAGSPLTAEDTARFFRAVAEPAQAAILQSRGQADFAYVSDGGVRCRINAFRQRGAIALALRLIADRIPSLAEIQIPNIVTELLRCGNGLLLVGGAAGSGKTTTLAALTEWINQSRGAHIITLEEPVEFLFSPGRSLVHQREVPTDTISFAEGLRAALREDPDVLLIGELRDAATAAAAVSAAETGHLVFATLHTADAAQAVDRILDLFPPHQQPQLRTQLSMTLLGVVVQRLLERKDGAGRIAAREILLATPAVRNLIREGKTHQLLSAMQTGAQLGMCPLEAALEELVARGLVTEQAAAAQARDPEAFRRGCAAGGAL